MTRRFRGVLFASVMMASICSSSVVHAQNAASVPSTNGKTQFRADFFAAFGPVTALDIVQRLVAKVVLIVLNTFVVGDTNAAQGWSKLASVE